MQTSNPAAEIFAAALRQHQAGALREAEQTYKRVLALDPSHVDALHYLGVLAHQAGRNDIAVELIGRAISLNDRNPECHYNIGIAFGALGRFDEAAEASRKAINLKPDYAEAYLNLGNAMKAKGKREEAKSNYEQALALKAGLAAAHFNLANVLSDEGKLGEAVPHYEKALALRPNYAEALTNLGTVLLALGKTDEAEARHRAAIALNPRLPAAHGNLGDLFLKQKKYDEAIECYRKALAVDPNYAEVHNNLGAALSAAGKEDEALAHYEQAFTLKPKLSQAFFSFGQALAARGEIGRVLEIIRRVHEIEETAETRTLFGIYLADPRAYPFAGQYRDILIRAVSEAWGDPPGAEKSFGLADASLNAIGGNPVISAIVSRAIEAWPSRLSAPDLFGEEGLDELARDELFRALLVYERFCNIRAEKYLSALRSALLNLASEARGAVSGEALSLFSAFAQQCFNNEYVFFAPSEEQNAANRLRDRLQEALNRGESPPPLHVAAVAAYFPLYGLTGAERLLTANLPAEIQPLLRQQIAEPKEEREYRAAMPRLTTIEDKISEEVRDQYEQSPYPRWLKATSRVVRRMNIGELLRLRFPAFASREFPASGEFLVAGCGTGRQVMHLKIFIDFDRILAVDLSLASLGYAKRMMTRLGMNDIEFAQADILQLASLGRSFDVVTCTGVLHHMAAPLAAWRSLLSILRPGGVMQIGLYSELARHPIVEARKMIVTCGYGHSPEEIRGFRQEIMGMDEAALVRKVTIGQDFFNLSECRDLLFHVHEHRFTLPEIAQFLHENRLTFLGFDHPAEIMEQYAKRFPADEAATNLEFWNEFEHENPDTFAGMYVFWVQKPLAQ